MGEWCSLSKEQTRWCRDCVDAPVVLVLWADSNIRGEFICFQSFLGFSSLGYWPKGTEKCNVDNKLPIKKTQTLLHEASRALEVSHTYTTGHSALKNEAGQSKTKLSSFQLDVFYSLSVCHTTWKRGKTSCDVYPSRHFLINSFFLFLLVNLGILFSQPLKTQCRLRLVMNQNKERTVVDDRASFLVGLVRRRGTLHFYCETRLII